MSNVLAFRTPVGGVSVPVGTSKNLGTVDVSPYESIRVVADERVGSGSGMTVRLTALEGAERVAFLDQIPLAPHTQATRVYEVPGTHLSVDVDAAPGAGTDALDVLIYGWKA